jgi:cephalosporin hydroxylase
VREDQVEMAYHMPLLEQVASGCGVILELGVGHGNGSTRAFTRGLLKSGRVMDRLMHISVDSDTSKPDEKPDVPWWHMVHGRTEEPGTAGMVKALLKYRAPDLIFIDTGHTKEQMERELEIWSRLAYRKTTWLFHDTFMWGKYNPMVDAIQEFTARYPQWEYRELTRESHGLGKMQWVQGCEPAD